MKNYSRIVFNEKQKIIFQNSFKHAKEFYQV